MHQYDIPTSFTKSGSFYEAIVDDDLIVLNVENGIVTSLHVVYKATPGGKHISKPISLEQAISRHNVGLAHDQVLASFKAVGLGDIGNGILFLTDGSIAPNTLVERVVYFNEPFASELAKRGTRLSPSQINSFKKNVTEVPYSHPAKPENIQSTKAPVASETKSVKSRKEALSTIQSYNDEALGNGRRVLALIDQSETWLSIDQDHPTAKKVFCDLKLYHLSFEISFKTLALTYKLYSNLLEPNDILLLDDAVALNESIDSKMRQVTAMGYSDNLCQ
jgi:hypothetical protein